jgi:hypothetical protein
MWDRQPIGGHHAVFIEQDVEVDGSWRPIAFSGSAERALYFFEEVEEAFRFERGFDFEDAVEKVGLTWLAREEFRFSLIKRRNTSDVSPCVVKTAARSFDVLMAVSLVRTDADVNDGHENRVSPSAGEHKVRPYSFSLASLSIASAIRFSSRVSANRT